MSLFEGSKAIARAPGNSRSNDPNRPLLGPTPNLSQLNPLEIELRKCRRYARFDDKQYTKDKRLARIETRRRPPDQPSIFDQYGNL